MVCNVVAVVLGILVGYLASRFWLPRWWSPLRAAAVAGLIAGAFTFVVLVV